MTDREWLISDLKFGPLVGWRGLSQVYAEELADFILADRKRLIAEHRAVLERVKEPLMRWWTSTSTDPVEANTRVEDALRIIKSELNRLGKD